MPQGSSSSSSSPSSESSSNPSNSLAKKLPKPQRRTNLQNSYKAPLGYKLLNQIQEFKVSNLDLSKVKNDQNDLWIIRLPPGLRSKHLENFKIDLKEINKKKTNSSNQVIKLKEVILGNVLYEVFIQDLLIEDFKKFKNSKLEPETQEISQLSILIPNHESNQSQLYQPNKPITKVLFFRRKVEIESPIVNPTEPTNSLINKRIQPIKLETRLIPYGAQTDGISYEYPLRSEEDLKIREINMDGKRNTDTRVLKSINSHKKKAKVQK